MNFVFKMMNFGCTEREAVRSGCQEEAAPVPAIREIYLSIAGVYIQKQTASNAYRTAPMSHA